LIGTPGKKEYCLLSLILIQRLIFDFTKTWLIGWLMCVEYVLSVDGTRSIE
jgi:hypothetical protein